MPSEDLGLSIDMLDVDRIRKWAGLVEAHGDEVSKWAPTMAKEMNELADNLDLAVREIGQLRVFLAGAMVGKEEAKFRATNQMSLAEAFPLEQARLRVMLHRGEEIGTAGRFYCMTIENLLKRADEAAASHDLTQMILIYREMQGMQE